MLERKPKRNNKKKNLPVSTPCSTYNLQTSCTTTSRPVARSRIRQPVARRMPRNSRDSRVTITPDRNSVDTLPRFSMEDFEAISTTAGFVTCTTQEPSVKAPTDATDGSTVTARYGASTVPVRRIPERNECVAASHGKVPTCWGERDGETGRGVRVEGVQNVE